jgi:2-aminoethylphosphonate-pyruvate transaminase
MAKLGIKPLLPPEHQSNTLTAYYLPVGLSYGQLHDRLKEQGYVIYAGQGQLEGQIFRIANMGVLSQAQIQGFLDAFERICAAT